MWREFLQTLETSFSRTRDLVFLAGLCAGLTTVSVAAFATSGLSSKGAPLLFGGKAMVAILSTLFSLSLFAFVAAVVAACRYSRDVLLFAWGLALIAGVDAVVAGPALLVWTLTHGWLTLLVIGVAALLICLGVCLLTRSGIKSPLAALALQVAGEWRGLRTTDRGELRGMAKTRVGFGIAAIALGAAGYALFAAVTWVQMQAKVGDAWYGLAVGRIPVVLITGAVALLCGGMIVLGLGYVLHGGFLGLLSTLPAKRNTRS